MKRPVPKAKTVLVERKGLLQEREESLHSGLYLVLTNIITPICLVPFFNTYTIKPFYLELERHYFFYYYRLIFYLIIRPFLAQDKGVQSFT